MSVAPGGLDERPRVGPVQRQSWWELLFLHWRVSEQAIRALVPGSLEVDTCDGAAYVGLVPFTMTGVRPVWAPALPGLSSFHEVNVRTYVRHRGEPGVFFLSLDASNLVAVLAARWSFHLPYRFARMSLAHTAPGEVRYRSERRWPGPKPAGCAMTYGPRGNAAPATPGSLAHFLVERYILYTEHHGRLLRGRVRHAPYPLQEAFVRDLDQTLVAAAGLDHGTEPPLAHYAKGVSVEVFALEDAASA